MPGEERPFGSPIGGPLKPADRIYAELEQFIGPNVTRMAIRTFSKKTLHVNPEELISTDAPKLIQALRPLLRSMAGEAHAETLIKRLTREFQ